MKNNISKLLKQDIEKLLEKYKALYVVYEKEIPVKIEGIVYINDDSDLLQNSFFIQIFIPKNYPNEFPILVEPNNKIERIKDRHISKEGIACVEVEPIQFQIAQKGISLFHFVDHYVYKYLCGQIYFDEKQVWPHNEWAHEKAGIKQYFENRFKSENYTEISKALTLIIKKERNEKCFCGNGKKFKYCHLKELDDLTIIPKDYLKKYLTYFSV
jgi:hypothetical protein